MAADLPARPDKWYLGAGDGLIWAPPFPRWLESPGFWDEAHLFQYAVQPLFTLSFLAGGAVLEPRCVARRWTPAALTLDHRIGSLRARETRSAPGGALASEWHVRNAGRRPVTLDVVAWTAVDGAALGAGDVRAADAGLRYVYAVSDRTGHAARVTATLVLAPAPHSHAVARAERSTALLPPRFELTPFYDRWDARGRLGDELRHGGVTPQGLVYVGLHRRLRLAPGTSARLGATVALRLAGGPVGRRTTRPAATAADAWRRFLASAPSFRCSDPFFQRYWSYRWYGLRLNAIAAGVGNYPHPSVCEGIAYFHVPIAYSAQCHMRELRWLPDPTWARGVLRTFLHHQKPDGSFHGRIYVDHLEGTDFYHADWGGALEALDAAHPDAAFRAEVYPALARYAEWLRATRDRDGTGMLDVVNHYETGQEYMSRYQAVDSEADRAGWTSGMRLKGVDVTVYGYRLFRALERLAGGAGSGGGPASAARWRAAAERTARALREAMWDEAAGMFFDVNPATGARTGMKAAVCFYPYWTDVVDERHVDGLARHLFDPGEFWTPFPVPSSSVDDPLFSPDATWKGKRHNCPWNGRVWPMTNAHVVEALAHVVRHHRPDWAPRLGHLLRRFVRMMTFDGRVDRQNCFEHYHPYTGRPSVYRGIDDYQHSWVNDLIVSHVMGVVPRGEAGVTVWPLALGVGRALLEGIAVAGHRVRVELGGRSFRVRVDGRAAGGGKVGEAVAVDF